MNTNLTTLYKENLRKGTCCTRCGKPITKGYKVNQTNCYGYIGIECGCANKAINQTKDGATKKATTEYVFECDTLASDRQSNLIYNGFNIHTISDNNVVRIAISCKGNAQKLVRAINDNELQGVLKCKCTKCNEILVTTDLTQVKSSIKGTFGYTHKMCYKK